MNGLGGDSWSISGRSDSGFFNPRSGMEGKGNEELESDLHESVDKNEHVHAW